MSTPIGDANPTTKTPQSGTFADDEPITAVTKDEIRPVMSRWQRPRMTYWTFAVLFVVSAVSMLLLSVWHLPDWSVGVALLLCAAAAEGIRRTADRAFPDDTTQL